MSILLSIVLCLFFLLERWLEASVSTNCKGQPFSAISTSFLSLGTQVCHIRSIGEGPVIHIHPVQVDFGKIYVLKESSRSLNLSNQSFIPGLFKAHMVSRLWTVVRLKYSFA